MSLTFGVWSGQILGIFPYENTLLKMEEQNCSKVIKDYLKKKKKAYQLK